MLLRPADPRSGSGGRAPLAPRPAASAAEAEAGEGGRAEHEEATAQGELGGRISQQSADRHGYASFLISTSGKKAANANQN